MRDWSDEVGDDFFNRNIMMEETEAAIQILKKGKAPGLDNIDSDLLKEGDEELIEAETTTFWKLDWEL